MIDRREVLALALGALGIGGASHAAAQPLRIVTTHLPPLVFESDGQQAGALRELVGALCARLDLIPELSFAPWRRALLMATTMPRTAIFPLTRNAERENGFRWLAPLYEEHYIFMAPRGGAFDLQRPEEMTAKRVALLRGAAQAALLRERGFRHLVEGSSIDEIHRFLLAGMADAVFGERAIIQSSLRTRGGEQDFLRSRPVHSTSAWLAGSLDFSEDEARRFRQAMARLVADGSRRKIFKRYGLA